MPAETEGSARSPDIVIGDRFGASCGHGLADFVEALCPDAGLLHGPEHACMQAAMRPWRTASHRWAGMPCRSKCAGDFTLMRRAWSRTRAFLTLAPPHERDCAGNLRLSPVLKSDWMLGNTKKKAALGYQRGQKI